MSDQGQQVTRIVTASNDASILFNGKAYALASRTQSLD